MPKYEDDDDYKKRAKRRSAESADKKTITLKPGENSIRVLRTPKGKTTPSVFMEFGAHEKVGPEKKYLRCGIDPSSKKGKCFLCQTYIPKLRKKGKDTRAAELEPKTKLVVQAIMYDEENEKFSTTPKLWYPSKKVGDTLIGTILLSKRREYVHPKKGYNLNITRTGTTFTDTKYGAIEPDDEPSKIPEEVMTGLKPFDELDSIPKYDEKKQKAAINGAAFDDDDDEDDDEPKKKKRSRDDDDDEEDDDDDDDRKSKKGKKKKKKSRDDDDDEDEDSEDEDEDDDSSDDEDEDDDEDDSEDDDEEDDDEEDDEEPRKSKKKSNSVSKKKKRR